MLIYLTNKSYIYIILIFIGSLAQSVEQRTFNPLVERSNRSRPTKFYKPKQLFRLFSLVPELSDFLDCVQIVSQFNSKLSAWSCKCCDERCAYFCTISKLSQPPISLRAKSGTPLCTNQLAHVWRKSCHFEITNPSFF